MPPEVAGRPGTSPPAAGRRGPSWAGGRRWHPWRRPAGRGGRLAGRTCGRLSTLRRNSATAEGPGMAGRLVMRRRWAGGGGCTRGGPAAGPAVPGPAALGGGNQRTGWLHDNPGGAGWACDTACESTGRTKAWRRVCGGSARSGCLAGWPWLPVALAQGGLSALAPAGRRRRCHWSRASRRCCATRAGPGPAPRRQIRAGAGAPAPPAPPQVDKFAAAAGLPPAAAGGAAGGRQVRHAAAGAAAAPAAAARHAAGRGSRRPAHPGG